MLRDIYIGEKLISFGNYESCKHKGCAAHVSHPCEVCGRIKAQGISTIPKSLYEAKLKEQEEVVR